MSYEIRLTLIKKSIHFSGVHFLLFLKPSASYTFIAPLGLGKPKMEPCGMVKDALSKEVVFV